MLHPEAVRFGFPRFKPHPLLRNRHLMTIAAGFIPRDFRRFSATGTRRLFRVAAHTSLLAHVHFHKEFRDKDTLLVLHGLESSADAANVVGLAAKAFSRGMNVVRLNMRNCGGSMHLTPGLYNAGLSSDVHQVVGELAEADRLRRIMLAGYSLGGNIVLKAAGEIEQLNPAVVAVAAVSPPVDLEFSVKALERPENHVYEQWFLHSLRRKITDKARAFPDRFDPGSLSRISTIRQFDHTYTAPDGGYASAEDYYFRASSARVISRVRVPSLIITAQDDPIVPVEMFSPDRITNEQVSIVCSQTGGHAGFVQERREEVAHFDWFWAENRVAEFCASIPD